MAGHRTPKDKPINNVAAGLAGASPRTAYTNDEVRERLLEVRDIALDRSVDHARDGRIDGLARWQGVMERANSELDRMDDRAANGAGAAVRLIIEGYDPARLVYGSNGPKADA